MASCALTAFASVFAPQSCHDACSGFHEVFDFCAESFVRDFALKRVACVYNSFNLLTTTSGVFGGEYCCCQLREQVLMVAGVRRQRRDVGGGGGGDDLTASETSYVVNTKGLF